MPEAIEKIEFTIFDTETTGLSPKSGDRIVEIAAVRFKNKKKIATFETLVNPGRPISEAAFQVNRISEAMLSQAPRIETVLPKFLDFVQGSCLCSYNAGFDLEFLNNELNLLGQPSLQDVVTVDILRMARRLLPGLERYALWFVSERLGINITQRHRALADVEMTREVFNRLTGILRSKGITDFGNFSQLFAIKAHFLESATNQKLAQIQEAIDLGVKLKIKYLSSSGAEVTEREVIPKEIKQENGRNYLVGFCCLRSDERTFRVDNMLCLEILNES
jgi:DNA polymerase-3 subunit alpha (Gram-positive type)